MNRVAFLLVVGALVNPSIGAAQTIDRVEDFRAIANKIIVESKVFPLMRGAVEGQSSPEPTVTLLATNDGAVAKARFGYLLTDLVSLDATVSGPVAGGTAQLVSQKGLGAGVAADGTLRLVLSRTQHSQPVTAGMAAPAAPSVISNRHMTTEFSFDALVAAALDVATGIRAAGGPALARNAARGAPVVELFQQSPAVGSSAQSPQAAAAQLNDERGREAFADAFRLLANDMEAWQVDRAVVLSFTGGISRPSFTVAENAQFKSVTKTARTGEVSLGIITSARRDKLTRGYYVGGTITAGQAFNATARNTCLPVAVSGATQCRNAVLSDPTPTDIESYQADLRYFFSNLKFAVGFRPSYDRKAGADEKWSIEVPLMFLQNSKDLQSALADDKAGLTGGVTLGIKDTPDGPAFVAMFSVGSVFKLPGLPR